MNRLITIALGTLFLGLSAILSVPQAQAQPEVCGPGTYWDAYTNSCLAQNNNQPYPYGGGGYGNGYQGGNVQFCFSGIFFSICGGQ